MRLFALAEYGGLYLFVEYVVVVMSVVRIRWGNDEMDILRREISSIDSVKERVEVETKLCGYVL